MVETLVGRSEEALLADLQQLVALVEASQVDEARALSTVLAARWPESQPIQHMARVLEPPKAAATGANPGALWSVSAHGFALMRMNIQAAGWRCTRTG